MDIHNSVIHDPSLHLLPNHSHHQPHTSGSFQHLQQHQHQQQHLEHLEHSHQQQSLAALYHLPPSQSHLSCDSHSYSSSAGVLPPSLPSSTCIPSLIPPGVDPAHVDMRTFYPYQPNEVKHRKRTTRAQLKVLEDVFKGDTKPNAALRKKLASELEMTPRGVQVWFQNRRAKFKQQLKKAVDGSATGAANHPHLKGTDTALGGHSSRSRSNSPIMDDGDDFGARDGDSMPGSPVALNAPSLTYDTSPHSNEATLLMLNEQRRGSLAGLSDVGESSAAWNSHASVVAPSSASSDAHSASNSPSAAWTPSPSLATHSPEHQMPLTPTPNADILAYRRPSLPTSYSMYPSSTPMLGVYRGPNSTGGAIDPMARRRSMDVGAGRHGYGFGMSRVHPYQQQQPHLHAGMMGANAQGLALGAVGPDMRRRPGLDTGMGQLGAHPYMINFPIVNGSAPDSYSGEQPVAGNASTGRRPSGMARVGGGPPGFNVGAGPGAGRRGSYVAPQWEDYSFEETSATREEAGVMMAVPPNQVAPVPMPIQGQGGMLVSQQPQQSQQQQQQQQLYSGHPFSQNQQQSHQPPPPRPQSPALPHISHSQKPQMTALSYARHSFSGPQAHFVGLGTDESQIPTHDSQHHIQRTYRVAEAPLPGPLPSPNFSFGNPQAAPASAASVSSASALEERRGSLDTESSSVYDPLSRFGSFASEGGTSWTSAEDRRGSAVSGCLMEMFEGMDVKTHEQRQQLEVVGTGAGALGEGEAHTPTPESQFRGRTDSGPVSGSGSASDVSSTLGSSDGECVDDGSGSRRRRLGSETREGGGENSGESSPDSSGTCVNIDAVRRGSLDAGRHGGSSSREGSIKGSSDRDSRRASEGDKYSSPSSIVTVLTPTTKMGHSGSTSTGASVVSGAVTSRSSELAHALSGHSGHGHGHGHGNEEEVMSYPLPYPSSSAGASPSHQQPSHQQSFAHSLLSAHVVDTSNNYPLDNDETGPSQQAHHHHHHPHQHQHHHQHQHDPNDLNHPNHSHSQSGPYPAHTLKEAMAAVVGDDPFYTQAHPTAASAAHCATDEHGGSYGPIDTSLYVATEWMGVAGMHAVPAAGAVEYDMSGGDAPAMCVSPAEGLGLYLLGAASGAFGYHPHQQQ